MLTFLAITLAIFGPLNFAAWRLLTRLHPRRRAWIIFFFVIGNLGWLILPFLRSAGWAMRILRAALGPPWFGWQCFVFVYCAWMLLTALAWLPFLRRLRFASFARWPSRGFLAVSILGTLAGFYGALVPLRVEHVPLTIANLPREAEGMRVAVMSDLHVGLFSRSSRLEQIFRATRNAKPDVVLLAGDHIDDDPYFVPKMLRGAAIVSHDIPTFAVLGNHEMYGDPRSVIAQFRGSPVRLLVNEGTPFRGLWIAGLSDFAGTTRAGGGALAPDFDRTLNAPPGLVPILLAHQPKAFPEAKRRHLPLTLCGHSHGGQFGYRPLRWDLAGVFIPYHMGLYEEGLSKLFVTTGAGYWLLPFRLGVTPEVVIVELQRAR